MTAPSCVMLQSPRSKEERVSVSITRSKAVSSDLTWHITVNGKVLSLTIALLSALPQTIVSAQDMLSTLQCVDSCDVCGNSYSLLTCIFYTNFGLIIAERISARL